MKTRSLFLAVMLAQCKGQAAPAPSPAPPAPVATPSGADTAPGPSVGTSLPPFEAADQDGRRQTFDTLRGPNGLLLNFNRSVVW
jgi:hypothetical protein